MTNEREGRRRVGRLARGLLICALIAALGVVLPRALVTDGVADLPAEERALARKALSFAHIACADHPIEAALWQAEKVRHLDLADTMSEPSGDTRERTAAYEAEVIAYTLFALPLRRVEIKGGEAICRRWPR